ncbi:MAG: ABC transporter ATP-binding protein, partial [Ruminococcaceae bacterium]|nr:ABC transporter ATP-binding protein [Oscillospiraceae bacterium]
MKRILKKAQYVLPGIIGLTLVGTVISLMGVVFAFLSKRVLDVATGQAEGDLLKEGLLLFGFLAFQLVLDVVLSVLDVRVSGRFQIREKTNLFSAIMKKNYMQISEYHSGELLNRINSDVNIVTTGLIQMLPNLFFYVTRIISSFFALYVLDKTFAFLCLMVGPLIFITACVYRKYMKKLHKEHQEADGRVKSFMQETLKNLLVIKSFGCGEAAAEKSRRLQFKQFKLNLKRNRISILAHVFFYVGLTAGYYIALAWGAYKISKGLMTFGTLTALLQLVGQIQTPFQGISSLLPQYYAMQASGERLAEIEDLPEDTVSICEVEKVKKWSSVELSGVEFGYSTEKVLSGVDFSVKKGEFAVITGTSGTGKSTLLKVMLGIFPLEAGEGFAVLEDG